MSPVFVAEAAHDVASQAAYAVRLGIDVDFIASFDEAQRVQAGLLRDILGNPFRPITFDPDWRTTTVVSLARRIYE